MSGISGIFYKTENQSKISEKTMAAAMLHRGGDFVGYYNNKHISIAHNRKLLMGAAADSNQPVVGECGGYVTALDGQIYNIREIATKYNLQLKTEADTEAIVKLFIVKGDDFITELNGSFALCIYSIEDNILRLYRDRLGIKPLFYADTNDFFVFGSELKSIATVPDIKPMLTINNNAIVQYLHLGYIPAPNTIYNEVRKFEQGSMMLISAKQTEKSRWWNIDSRVVTSKVISNKHEALELIDELLNDSVRQQLKNNVPLGALLSGGIDSSLVTAVAAKHSDKPIDTFCIRFENSRYDESIWAARIARHIGTKHHEFTVTAKEAIEYLPVMINQYDEPYGDTSAIPTMLVSKFASECVTVALSGDGGDELFHGYGSYLWANRLDKTYIKLLNPFIRTALKAGNDKCKRVAEMFRRSTSPESNIFSQEQSLFSYHELHKILSNPQFEIWKPDINVFERNISAAERQAIFDMLYYLPDDLLIKTDRGGMLFGLDIKPPLLDFRMVELALKIDPNLKIKDGKGKYLLRKLLNKYIPEDFTNRPKHGFSMPLEEWMRNELKETFAYYLSSEVVNRYNIFNCKEVRKLTIRFYNRNELWLYNRLWLIISVHLWMEQRNSAS